MKKYLCLFITVLLVACAGLQPATSLDEKLAYAYSTDTALRQTATTALQAGSITVADAIKVEQLTDEVRTALDAAKAANVTGDATTALQKLQQATALLTALQTYLNSKGVHQ